MAIQSGSRKVVINRHCEPQATQSKNTYEGSATYTGLLRSARSDSDEA